MPTCSITAKDFKITPQEEAIMKKIAPTFDGKTFELPQPTLCPDERARQRTMHRNEQHLYRNKSFFSQNPVISVYPISDKTTVVSKEEWFSEAWDSLDYGRDFDFTKNFFPQYYLMQCQVPRASTVTMNNENCEYTTGTAFCKDCYLINSSEHCQNCSYSKLLQNARDVFDTSYAYDSELLYECFNVKKGYECGWVYNSQNVTECWFCDDLRNCQNCFLCTNLVGKQFYFGNEKMSESDYRKKVEAIRNNPEHLAQAKAFFSELRKDRTAKYAEILNSENCTGDFISNSKNCQDCYDMSDSQDCRYVHVGVNIKDCVDCSNMYLKPELSYQVLGTINTYNVHFSLYVFDSSDMWYCEQCYNSKNCFGCIGLRNKEYCIFNKQYNKESYESMVARIIAHMQKSAEWGQFFPAWMSPFFYNKSLAHEYFPLSKAEAENRNYRWEEESTTNYLPQDYIVPKDIKTVDDSVCQKILACAVTGKNYRIQKNELKFYRTMRLIIPGKGPETRYAERMKLRNARHLCDRKCSECGVEVQSTFAKERPEKILCAKCYGEAVS
ncbi:MAG TPA: hypothetical protein VIT68_00680 [Candidatus Gracilibacteria bacterium]